MWYSACQVRSSHAWEVQKQFVKLFADPNDRVKAAAAVAFGKIGHPPSQLINRRVNSSVAESRRTVRLTEIEQ